MNSSQQISQDYTRHNKYMLRAMIEASDGEIIRRGSSHPSNTVNRFIHDSSKNFKSAERLFRAAFGLIQPPPYHLIHFPELIYIFNITGSMKKRRYLAELLTGHESQYDILLALTRFVLRHTRPAGVASSCRPPWLANSPPGMQPRICRLAGTYSQCGPAPPLLGVGHERSDG